MEKASSAGGADIASRVAITSEQMEGLIEFIEKNPALAKGKTKPLRLSKKLWMQCAKILNAYENGAKKNGKQWAKSWTDMKYRVRRRAMELHVARTTDQPLSSDLLLLSQVEERILSLIGREGIEDVVIKSDLTTRDGNTHPLECAVAECYTSSNETSIRVTSLQTNNLVEDAPLPLLVSEGANEDILIMTEGRKRYFSQQETSDDQPSTTPERRPRLNDDKFSSHSQSSFNETDSGTSSVFFEMERCNIRSHEQMMKAIDDIRNEMSSVIKVIMKTKNIVENRSED